MNLPARAATSTSSGRKLDCHTIARFNQFFWDSPWNITSDPKWQFTLIHFDQPFAAAIGAPRRCEVQAGGTSEVYHFYSNGIVKRARGSKSSNQAVGASPHDRGYWFDAAFDASVFWPMTGQVVSMHVRVDLLADLALTKSIPIDIDGMPGTMSPF